MTRRTVTTREEFKAAREELEITIEELGRILNTNPDTIRKWESRNARTPNPIACRVLEWMLNDGFEPHEADIDG